LPEHWVCYIITPMDVVSVIQDFDDFLFSKNTSFSGIVIGGGALALMGITTRGTKDIDVLKSKLFAYCDRGQDIADCIKMNPSQAELLEALDWVKNQDQNPQWSSHVQKCFAKLALELSYDF